MRQGLLLYNGNRVLWKDISDIQLSVLGKFYYSISYFI